MFSLVRATTTHHVLPSKGYDHLPPPTMFSLVRAATTHHVLPSKGCHKLLVVVALVLVQLCRLTHYAHHLTHALDVGPQLWGVG